VGREGVPVGVENLDAIVDEVLAEGRHRGFGDLRNGYEWLTNSKKLPPQKKCFQVWGGGKIMGRN
jgi:hypothetical protein